MSRRGACDFRFLHPLLHTCSASCHVEFSCCATRTNREMHSETLLYQAKQSGKSQRREEKRRRNRSKKRKSLKKEDQGARKGRKVAKHCVFPMFCGSRGSKSRLAKAAGAEPAGQMRYEKFHADVARSTFPSQNVENTPGSEHFFEVAMSKKRHAVVARSTCRSQNARSTPASDRFWKLRCRQAQRIVRLVKSEQHLRVL